jgi:hypothetical protein
MRSVNIVQEGLNVQRLNSRPQHGVSPVGFIIAIGLSVFALQGRTDSFDQWLLWLTIYSLVLGSFLALLLHTFERRGYETGYSHALDDNDRAWVWPRRECDKSAETRATIWIYARFCKMTQEPIVAPALLTQRDFERVGSTLSHCTSIENNDGMFDHLLAKLQTVSIEPLGNSVVLMATKWRQSRRTLT